jgi:hypothetical protein
LPPLSHPRPFTNRHPEAPALEEPKDLIVKLVQALPFSPLFEFPISLFSCIPFTPRLQSHAILDL